jgi:SAM-dependent methyltransferase
MAQPSAVNNDRSLIRTLIKNILAVTCLLPRGSREVTVNTGLSSDYDIRLKKEIEIYGSVENVHDLPEIFHYWSNKFLVPKYHQFGFSNPAEFYLSYIVRQLKDSQGKNFRILSIGSGNSELEVNIVEKLLMADAREFVFECLDINPMMLERGKKLAQEKGILGRLEFVNTDINSWRIKNMYQIVIANQALHHFVELEVLFDKIYLSLCPDGYFLTDDIIGRRGHMRWPEALEIVNNLWKELPDRYKYNHQLTRFEAEYDNWDCSKEGFEGIRSQDILPLLIERFHFELFVGFANVIDIFIDRSFGHNFNPDSQWDRDFIDRAHWVDEKNLQIGHIKPTHMTAALTKSLVGTSKTLGHLTPQYCVRSP